MGRVSGRGSRTRVSGKGGCGANGWRGSVGLRPEGCGGGSVGLGPGGCERKEGVWDWGRESVSGGGVWD